MVSDFIVQYSHVARGRYCLDKVAHLILFDQEATPTLNCIVNNCRLPVWNPKIA